MNESRDELEQLARRLCDVAGWEPGLTDDDGTKRCVNIMCNVFWANTPRKVLFMFEEDWLPLARIVAERDAQAKEIGRLEELAYMGEHHFPDLTYKARVEELVAERDRLREAMDRVQCLLEWWTSEMHRTKKEKQLIIAPVEILIDQRIDQLRAALEGK